MIEVNNVSKRFGKSLVLKDISFTLNEGEIIALIGENGAGKSTLMRILTGYIAASSGDVKINNFDILKQRTSALSFIGYVPEISSLYGDMNVYDFLLWIANLWKIKNPNEAIIETSKQLQITDVLLQKIDTLSKGFKKRVEIASALLHSPKLLILDEPTDGLDPNQKQDIRNFIAKYAKNNIVLIATHVLEDADIAHRVLMLSKGNLIIDTSLRHFKSHSKTKNLNDAFYTLSRGLEQ